MESFFINLKKNYFTFLDSASSTASFSAIPPSASVRLSPQARSKHTTWCITPSTKTPVLSSLLRSTAPINSRLESKTACRLLHIKKGSRRSPCNAFKFSVFRKTANLKHYPIPNTFPALPKVVHTLLDWQNLKGFFQLNSYDFYSPQI